MCSYFDGTRFILVADAVILRSFHRIRHCLLFSEQVLITVSCHLTQGSVTISRISTTLTIRPDSVPTSCTAAVMGTITDLTV